MIENAHSQCRLLADPPAVQTADQRQRAICLIFPAAICQAQTKTSRSAHIMLVQSNGSDPAHLRDSSGKCDTQKGAARFCLVDLRMSSLRCWSTIHLFAPTDICCLKNAPPWITLLECCCFGDLTMRSCANTARDKFRYPSEIECH